MPAWESRFELCLVAVVHKKCAWSLQWAGSVAEGLLAGDIGANGPMLTHEASKSRTVVIEMAYRGRFTDQRQVRVDGVRLTFTRGIELGPGSGNLANPAFFLISTKATSSGLQASPRLCN